MKKFMALLTVAAASLTPMASLQAQTTEDKNIWTALSETASLENARTMESVYGSFELGDTGSSYKVDYRVNVNNSMTNAEKTASLSKINGMISIVSQGTDTGYQSPFKSLSANITGELISVNEEDIYLKLTDLTLNADTEDTDLKQEINDAMVVVNLVKGNWYHLSLADFYGEELNVMSSKDFLESFKKDSKQALKGMIEEMVTEQVKQQQYYTSMIGDFDDWTATEALEPTLLQDYGTYLTSEAKQNPVDLKGLVTKGVLECDDDTYLGTGLENGFQYPGCWPAIAYAGQLTTEEKELTEMLYANSGEWIYEDGKWYYVEIYPTTDVTTSDDGDLSYDDIVSLENFDYDEKAIEEEVSKIMKGVDLFLNENFFIQHDIISGPNEGFQFYSLKRAQVLSAAKNFASAIGETMDATDEAELRKLLSKMSLAGIYNIREDNGVIDNLFARFTFNDAENFFKNFDLNYRYKLMNWEDVNKIQIPTKVTELESLRELMD